MVQGRELTLYIVLVCVQGLMFKDLTFPKGTEPYTFSTSQRKGAVGGEEMDGPEKVPEDLVSPALLIDLVHGALMVKDFANDEKYFIGTMMNPTQPAPGHWNHPAATSPPSDVITAVTTAAVVPETKMAAVSPTPAARIPGSGGQRGQGSPPESGTPTIEVEEETTTTLITTTTVTTVQTPVFCNMNVIEAEGLIESLEYSGSPFYGGLDCNYLISVYTGFAVELQVKTLNLLEGELLTVEGLQGDEPLILANEALMTEGQIVRSPTRQVLIHFQSSQSVYPGIFRFHCRAYLLSCGFPLKPAYGDLSVSDLYPGGKASFRCDPGFELHGVASITCLNLTRPQWSSKEPECMAVCGAIIQNATVGHIISPDLASNHGNNLTCHWLIEATNGQKLHLHFERLSLDEDNDRLIIRSGNFQAAPLTFHSDIDDVPNRGVVSDAHELFIELVSENSGVPLVLALRYEAFDEDHCYEPFLAHGNFSSSDRTYAVGAIVEFSCNPGYALAQGSSRIECMEEDNPQWNATEPLCRATCGGDMAEPSGVIFSPEWPEVYGKNQDCVWGLHVEEDKRIVIEIEILNIRRNDILSIFDGADLNARILGQYMGSQKRFKVFSSASDVTIQFQSDVSDPAFGETHGFIIHFAETLRNDTCSSLPPVLHGWKTVSHSNLIRGTVVTYQCEPGYDISSPDILMCQWDLSWSNAPPTCEKMAYCVDPGQVGNGQRLTAGPHFPVGSQVQYVCDEGHAIEGSGTLTCYNRDTRSPKWSDRLPKCILTYEPCLNPGVPDNGYQTLYKQHYQAGESLRFFCYDGFELIGEVTITCLAGRPSQWNSPPPFCKVAYEELYDDRKLQVSRTTDPSHQMEGGNILVAIFLPIILVVLLIGGIYLYYTKFQGKSIFRLPLSNSHSYSPITVESDFNNPLYEAGDTREYEVSI